MKKILVMGLLLLCCKAQAQMTDTLGALTLQGALTQGSLQGVNQMQNALENTQFQQDLAALISEIQITFGNDYSVVNKEILAFEGFDNITWNVIGVSKNEFYIDLIGIDGAQCFICQGNQWHASHVDINENSQCNADDNHVKMYFKM